MVILRARPQLQANTLLVRENHPAFRNMAVTFRIFGKTYVAEEG